MVRKIKVVVETGRDIFSCFMTGGDGIGFSINGTGKTAKKAIDDFLIAYKEIKDYFKAENKDFPDLDFEFVFDVGAFFSYYPLNITAFAEYTGINASLLRQYACGVRTPKEKNLEKIRQAINKVSHDIGAGSLIDKPVLQYA